MTCSKERCGKKRGLFFMKQWLFSRVRHFLLMLRIIMEVTPNEKRLIPVSTINTRKTKQLTEISWISWLKLSELVVPDSRAALKTSNCAALSHENAHAAQSRGKRETWSTEARVPADDKCLSTPRLEECGATRGGGEFSHVVLGVKLTLSIYWSVARGLILLE